MTDLNAEAERKRPTSKRLYERALVVEPNGVAASDIRAPSGGWEPFPIFMARGTGAYVEDVDGNRYLDYLGATGPLILGHRPTNVLEAVHRTLDQMSQLLGFNHELEVLAAEAMVEAVPCWEQMRFSNTGTEAVMLALRIARAYTDRTTVLRFEGHFHGWADTAYFGVDEDKIRSGYNGPLEPVPSTHGMLESLTGSTIVRRWNDPDELQQTFAELGDRLAAVICEPLLAGPVITPKPGYLELLRALCTMHGAVLIFDEVKTSFRIALGGVQEVFGVLPDLSTTAKAMAAGFPVAAVGGRKELFEPFTRGYIRQGSTYQANPIVLAATLATLDVLKEHGFYERLNALGARLSDGLTALADEAKLAAYACGCGSIVQLVFADHRIDEYRDFVRSNDGATARKVFRRLLEDGVICSPGGGWLVSAAHSEADIETTLEAAGRAFMDVAADHPQ